jgi:phosphatidylserine/phosphatidylglycerophosphate/cardiolipin synthase-like enzyme
MTKDEVISALAQSLEDHRLSRAERGTLQQAFEATRGDLGASEIRRLAFELARGAGGGEVVDWLEGVLKVLDRREPAAANNRVCEAHFSPREECWRRIVQLLEGARQQVDICVFTITDDRISDVIIATHQRGIAMRILTDDEKAWDEGSDVERFRKAGIPLRVDHTEHHMHHKFALFDHGLLLSGSYNWTRGASQYNEENFVVTSERPLITQFSEAFERLWNRLG